MNEPDDAPSERHAAGAPTVEVAPLFTQALRVAVKRSVRDEELLVAKLLEDGTPPPGMKAALLVLLDADEDLLQTKF